MTDCTEYLPSTIITVTTVSTGYKGKKEAKEQCSLVAIDEYLNCKYDDISEEAIEELKSDYEPYIFSTTLETLNKDTRTYTYEVVVDCEAIDDRLKSMGILTDTEETSSSSSDTEETSLLADAADLVVAGAGAVAVGGAVADGFDELSVNSDDSSDVNSDDSSDVDEDSDDYDGVPPAINFFEAWETTMQNAGWVLETRMDDTMFIRTTLYDDGGKLFDSKSFDITKDHENEKLAEYTGLFNMGPPTLNPGAGKDLKDTVARDMQRLIVRKPE